MGHIRVRSETGTLQFDFQYLKQRCREQTVLPDTKPNRKKLQTVLDKIEAEITLGTFVYEKYFPNSALLPKIQQAKARLTPNYTETPLFSNFVEQWLMEQSVSWRTSTEKGYRDMLRLRLTPFFGEKEVSNISKADILKFRSEIAKSGSGKLKAKTINKHIKLLKMILNEAADRFHFTPQHQNIKPLKEDKVHIEPFSIDEVNSIIANIREDWRDYVLIRFFTGMRSGEIDGLKWTCVNFEHNEIQIRETYSKGTFQYTKNDGSQREIEMSTPVKNALLERYKNRNKDCDLVFHTNNFQPIDLTNFLNRVWKPLLNYLGLAYRKPYQTRHTAATFWLASGENANWIAKQMGHTSTQMLFTVYARFVPNLTHKDGSAMERLLAQKVDRYHQPFTMEPSNTNLADKQNSSQMITTAIENESAFWDQFIQPTNSIQSHAGGIE